MRLINNNTLMQLSPKEYNCLLDMFERLKKYPQWEPTKREVEKILQQTRQTRQFTYEQLEKYMEWRRPKGTPMASPCYWRFLQNYFKLSQCPKCHGKGGSEPEGICKICHGSGFSPEYKQFKGEKR